GVFGIDDGFELELFFAEYAGGFGFVEAEVALLDGVGEFGVDAGRGFDLEGQGQGVDGLVRRVEEEPSDVGGALLVFEVGGAAVEDQLPVAQAFLKGELGDGRNGRG